MAGSLSIRRRRRCAVRSSRTFTAESGLWRRAGGRRAVVMLRGDQCAGVSPVGNIERPASLVRSMRRFRDRTDAGRVSAGLVLVRPGPRRRTDGAAPSPSTAVHGPPRGRRSRARSRAARCPGPARRRLRGRGRGRSGSRGPGNGSRRGAAGTRRRRGSSRRARARPSAGAPLPRRRSAARRRSSRCWLILPPAVPMRAVGRPYQPVDEGWFSRFRDFR